MLIGIEIAMAVVAVAILISGRLAFGARTVVIGWRARVLGLVALLPSPIMFLLRLVLGDRAMSAMVLMSIEIAAIAGCGVLIYLLGLRWAVDPANPPKAKD